MRKSEITQFAVIALAMVSILFSTYQTYMGYLLAVGNNHLFALAISVLISFGLVVLNMKIWEYVEKGLGDMLPNILLVYLTVAAFSIAANFNSFYSEYMLKEIVNDDLENISVRITELESKFNTAVRKQSNIERIIEKVNAYKTTLMRQVNDRYQPGVGPRAQLIIDSLEKTLGTELTVPYGDNLTVSKGFKDQIEELLANKVNNISKQQLIFQDDLEVFIGKSQLTLDSLQLGPKNQSTIIAIQSLASEYNVLSEKATNIIADSNLISLKRYTYHNQELGKISHSFTSAKLPKYRNAGLLSFALALLIDLITPTVIFFSQRK